MTGAIARLDLAIKLHRRSICARQPPPKADAEQRLMPSQRNTRGEE